MDLARVTERFGLDAESIDALTEALLGNQGLKAAQQRCIKELSLEQVYAACQVIARDVLGDDLAEIAPQMALDRLEMAEAHYSAWRQEAARAARERARREAEAEARLLALESSRAA